MVLADIVKRWQLLSGISAILSTGIDEHGMKVTTVQIDAIGNTERAEVFKDLASRMHMLNDHFVRTTEPKHKDAVQFAWHLLDRAGYIYKSNHEGWYSVSDETFFPASSVHVIIEPTSGRKIMATKDDGKEVEWTSETNYHFKLSAFREPLLRFYEEHPQFITPRSRMDEIVASVRSGLDDLSISRPSERLSWGIPVPHDTSQTIYVWLDALFNYITQIGFPWTPGKESSAGWPADCHVIGKDITRFHCIYWPAFLLALNIPLPKQILTHAHWTLGRRKMAKSTGVGVDPFLAMERFGIDGLRYYLAKDGGIIDDADYANEFVADRYNAELKNTLGNLASRILKPTKWKVSRAVMNFQAGKLAQTTLVDIQEELQTTLSSLKEDVSKDMLAFNFRGALQKIMAAVHMTNSLMQNTAPWKLAHSKKSGDRERLDLVIFECSETLRISGILLQPFMPGKATQLLEMLGVLANRRSFKFASFGLDPQYGRRHDIEPTSVSKGSGKALPALFPTLTCEN
ncbi:MAG: methionyl-tRNA synthetase [Vezdaea aestivalis]|nr:MAG: methionyl-tRNA synthetase [Vezdaea aestivalis]